MKNAADTFTNRTRVLVLADDPLARAGISSMLDSQPDTSLIAQLSFAEGTLDALEIYQPEVIVWDLGADSATALEMAPDVVESGSAIIALIPDETMAIDAWLCGLRSLLPRNVSSEMLGSAVAASARGLVVLGPTIASGLFAGRGQPSVYRPVVDLTPREREVLKQLGEGMSNKSIAFELGISEHTVKFHVNSIMSKLGAQSRTEAVILATRLGLVPL